MLGELFHRAIAADQREIESQHLRFHGIVQQQRTWCHVELNRKRIFHATRERVVRRQPLTGVLSQHRGRLLEGPLVQASPSERIKQRARDGWQGKGIQMMQQTFVGKPRDLRRFYQSGRQRFGHQSLVHGRGAAHRMMPIHIAKHLVFGKQQGLQC